MASSRSRLVGRVMATLLVVGALFPMSASAQDDRGSCFRESGDKAISACNRAIKANPKDAQAYYSRGVEWRKKGQYGKAIADYSEAIRQDPTYVNAYYNRGIAWSNTGIVRHCRLRRSNQTEPEFCKCILYSRYCLGDEGQPPASLVGFPSLRRTEPIGFRRPEGDRPSCTCIGKVPSKSGCSGTAAAAGCGSTSSADTGRCRSG